MKKRVCLLVTLLALVIMGFATSAEAAEIIDRGYCGGEGDGTNLTWTFDSDGVLVIEGQGKMKDWSDSLLSEYSPDWHKYSDAIDSVIVQFGVTSIGNAAFYYTNIGSIVLPESLTNIEYDAFRGCVNLHSIDLPEQLATIGGCAFEDCKRLSSIDLPKSLVSIENRTFVNCTSLSSIYLPDSLVSIGPGAFVDCTSLSNIYLPESLTDIEYSAFSGCTSLTSIALTESLTNIDSQIFVCCSNLSRIYIPSNVKTIYQSAFWGTALTDIYYGGTEGQWEEIKIDNTEKNTEEHYDGFINATIHYNSPGLPEPPSPELPSPDPYLVDAASFNKDLASVAANLSLRAYDDVASNESVENYLINDLGFGEGDNFYIGSYGGTLAYTLATRKYYGTDADGNTDILVITAQGSPNPYEMIPEAVSKPDYDNKKAFGGHVPYSIVEEYYNAIVEDLPMVVESGKKYKVLVTGHGLAGAAANLVAANLSDGRIKEVNTERADVFCYTFGALNPLDENAVIKGDYEKDNYDNIHNVYNLYDTCSPLQYGVGEGFGMFGQMHLFVLDNRTPEQRNQGNDESIFRYVYRQIYYHVNHDMENYYSYVEGVKDGQNDLITEESAKHVSVIIGPIDVDVYCDEELVGRVIKNVVDATVNSIDISVEGDSKTILYPDDRQYEIRIKALDEGRITLCNIDLGRGETKVIKNISLVKGKLFSGTVGKGHTASEFKLYVMDAAGKVLREAQADDKNVELVRFYKLMSFVPRLYRNFLKREPDETGLGDWVDALCSGRATGAKLVCGFVLSKEYQANNLSDEEYITAFYRIIFNREPDKAGLESWIIVLDNGCTNEKILEGFINSDEFGNICKDLGIERGSYRSPRPVDNHYLITSFVARLYRLCLGRRYEREGLDNWVRALVYGNATGSSVVKDFFNSQEFLNRNLTDEQFVTVAYRTILNREPDTAGLESWLDALRRGYTRNQVLDGFLKSTEFGGLCKQYGITR